MTDKTITVDGSPLSQEEWLEVFKLHSQLTSLRKAALAVALVVALVGLVVYILNAESLKWFDVVTLLVFLLGFAVAIWGLTRAPRSVAMYAWRAQQSQSWSAVPTAVGIKGIERHTEDGKEYLPWNSFLSWKANNSILMLYRTRSNARIFLRRFFKTDEDWSTFCTIVEENVG